METNYDSSENLPINNPKGTATSGATIFYWLDSTEPIKFQNLSRDQETEVNYHAIS